MLIPILALALAAAPANGDARFEAFAQKYVQADLKEMHAAMHAIAHR